MDASFLSFLHTNDFRCVIRYYYGVNANTVIIIIIHNESVIQGSSLFREFFMSSVLLPMLRVVKSVHRLICAFVGCN